jgi:DNA-binding LacI/PurR family transcriptional regulator
MTTIRQLAQLADVSICTVSKALRDDPRISAPTRQRIQELAVQHCYRPNRLTQHLIQGKSHTIGCIVPDVANSFHARLLRGVLAAVSQSDRQVLILETHNQLLRTLKAMHALMEQRVEGILIASEHYAPIPRPVILEMRSHGIIPIGLDATRFATPVDSVRTDENRLADIAVSYLMELGHRRIAYIGPLPTGPLIDRARAFSRAFRRHHLTETTLIDTEAEDYALFSAAAVFDHLSTLPTRPTALIAWEDRIAARLIQEAHARGIDVPGAVSILGCANFDLGDLVTPRLTSIEQFPEEVGRQAVELLLARVTGVRGESERRREVRAIPPRLVPRASCERWRGG